MLKISSCGNGKQNINGQWHKKAQEMAPQGAVPQQPAPDPLNQAFQPGVQVFIEAGPGSKWCYITS